MDKQPLFPRVELNIDGVDYNAIYFTEEGVLYVLINGKTYFCVAGPKPEATVRAMMIEEALQDTLRSRR